MIQSQFVDQTFEISVQVPVSRTDGSERFPVLYLTDSYDGVSFSRSTAMMQLGGDIPRFITVGIGYEMEHSLSSLDIRNRDLTQVPMQGPVPPSLSGIIQGVPELNLTKTSGGAPEFLQFIREELQPFIDENYPTVPEDRGYWGDSLGGLFGLYVLFNQPDTFNRYIIGSPSIWWEDRAIMKDARAFVDSHSDLPVRLFLGVGALEEQAEVPALAEAAMVTNMFELESMLQSANLEGLELSSYLFPNETHTSVISMNYIRGVQSVYTRPAFSFLLQALMFSTSD
ncbi:MAG: alpha/beta hydrolase [Gammaproteobacteria bacterium]|nr:alpha/beta hydrolase [Gammaproteobacteria bacterium]